MSDKYAKCKDKWDKIFKQKKPTLPSNASSGNEILDKGIQWVCKETNTILDFGCGNGTILFLCSLYGTKKHIGIDFSQNAIENAQEIAAKMVDGDFHFIQGGISQFKQIEDASVDAVILSNIIDNLFPEDAHFVLKETARILREKGKVLVKLNPFITDALIKEWKIKIIKDNLLDDGFILWNNTRDQWEKIFTRNFIVHKYEEIYYPEVDQYNRMFMITKINPNP